nr:ARL14 effector protein [Leptinotarsa decemlineata]
MVSPEDSEMSSETSDDEYNPTPAREHRTARKSVSQPTQPYSTRRQAARNASKALRATSDHFMANFNPETSVREKRKLSRKIHPPSNVRRPAGAIYDENGVHISSGVDLCDCLNEDCVGCFFECPKCESMKCSTDCRVHRKYMVEQIEYHGYDHVIKNPLYKH